METLQSEHKSYARFTVLMLLIDLIIMDMLEKHLVIKLILLIIFSSFYIICSIGYTIRCASLGESNRGFYLFINIILYGIALYIFNTISAIYMG